MAEAQNHPTEELQDAIDGRLDARQQAALDLHLAVCAACRREMAALQWTKAQLARAARTGDVPDDLDALVRRALNEEDRQAERPAGARSRPATRLALRKWLAAAAALVAIVWVVRSVWPPAAPAQAAADFRAFVSGAVPLEIQTADPSVLEARLQAAGLPFAVRVFDFGMMNYALAGGGVHRIAARPGAVFAYRSSDGRAVVCRMYEGDAEQLPAPTDRRRQNDIEFLVYRDRDLTIVFWEEGNVLCVLVADGDPEAAIQLAFAKAVKV